MENKDLKQNFIVATHLTPENEEQVKEATTKLIKWFQESKMDFNTSLSAMSTLIDYMLSHMPLTEDEIREMTTQLGDKIYNNVLKLRGSQR